MPRPCDYCSDGEHDECERPVYFSPPSWSSSDGLGTVEECCCGELRTPEQDWDVADIEDWWE